ncbi:MAG: DUF3822 family protein [Bacteroidota bacterium]|nr:DUF3822 family protein [Bacteroidota bacterium]
MTQKTISYYADPVNVPENEADMLILEIGQTDLVCMHKSMHTGKIEGFELFHINEDSVDWSDVFFQLKLESKFMNQTYREVHCHFNFPEALILPEKSFTAASAEDYLSLVYGSADKVDYKFDSILLSDTHLVNAYRIRKTIHEQLCRQFVLYKSHHIYTRILEDLLNRQDLSEHFMRIQFYSKHCILAVIKENRLQLIQSFSFTADEDLLYHLIHCINQFSFTIALSHLEISGIFDNGNLLHQQLQGLFGLITFDETKPDGILKLAGSYPAYYFNSFYKLAV